MPKTEIKVEAKSYNPYSVENMRKAMSSLMMKDVQLLANNKEKFAHGKVMSTNSTATLAINKTLTKKESLTLVEAGITATHYYIKFMPVNDADYAKLKVDSNLMLYPFPLNAAISQYSGSYLHYCHKDIQGLRRPPQSSFWERQLKITAINGAYDPSGLTNPLHSFFSMNDLVTIATLSMSPEYTYSTTIHELAHAAHWDTSNLSFVGSAPTATESWAAGVEWFLTKMEYPQHLGMKWKTGGNYRNVVIDMIDTPSDVSYFAGLGYYVNFGFGAPNDQVEGYNIVDIQNALINNPNTWNEWKTNIKNNYSNATENNLDALFDAWLAY